jgi:Uncharacterized protein conserved in bacteria (DUF2252)
MTNVHPPRPSPSPAPLHDLSATMDDRRGLGKADRGRVSIHIERKRKRRASRGAFAKLTAMVDGRPRITSDPPIRRTISDDEQDDLTDHLLADYRLTLQEDRRSLFDRFTVVDVVRQVVGVGSVGMQV